MFLAIINDTYSEVKIEIANQRNEFELADYFKRGYNNMMGKLGRRDKIVDIQNALKLSDANGDGMLTFDEIRANLKKYVFCLVLCCFVFIVLIFFIRINVYQTWKLVDLLYTYSECSESRKLLMMIMLVMMCTVSFQMQFF